MSGVSDGSATAATGLASIRTGKSSDPSNSIADFSWAGDTFSTGGEATWAVAGA